MAQKSLLEFVKQAWNVLEPGNPFMPGKHIDAIVEHLEAVTAGQIPNLLINIPFRCCKSLLVAVFWMCWEWTNKPETRWLYASYKQDLSIRDSLKCRRVIESPWYQRNWGNVVRLAGDQNAKEKFENDRTGYRLIQAKSGTTGEGGHRIVLDDPHSVMDGFSPVELEKTISWFDEAWSSRWVNPNTVARVVVGQRIAHNDLSAHLLEKGGWTHLMMPMRFEKQRACVTSIWKDWRTEEGELLWPEWLGEEKVKEIENKIGIYATAGQLQQAPNARGGNYIAIEKFRSIKPDQLPIMLRWVRAWDLATEDKEENDFTVGAKVAMDNDGNMIIGDIQRGQWKWPRARAMIAATAQTDQAEIGIEAVAGFKVAYQNLMEVLPSTILCRELSVHGNKLTRSLPWIARLSNSKVLLVEGDWNGPLITECEQWRPSAKNQRDDQIDAVSLAHSMLTEGSGITRVQRADPSQRMDRRTAMM